MKLIDILESSVSDLGSKELLRKRASEYNGGDFKCSFLTLTSLEGTPSKITGDFICTHNKLISLKGSPSRVDGCFNCSHNDLTSLEGAPQKVDRFFNCSNNELTSLEGAPSETGGSFECAANKLTSLKDVHKIVKKMDGTFWATGNPIKSHVLGILLIKGCKKLLLDVGPQPGSKVQKIINKYLPNHEGMKGVLKCQEELFAADLDDYAQL